MNRAPRFLLPAVGVLLLFAGCHAAPNLSIADGNGREGETVDFPVTLAETTTHQVTIYCSTEDGSANGGLDYLPRSNERCATIAPGSRHATIKVTAIADGVPGSVEGHEDFTLRLNRVVNGTIIDPTASGLIF